MRVRILTIFPELFGPFLEASLVGRARAEGLLEVEALDLRQFTEDPHRSVDDEPYGGGGGMVMTAPPWIKAVRELEASDAEEGGSDPPDRRPPDRRPPDRRPPDRRAWRVLLSPQGERLGEPKVRELAARGDLILLCGRYEGLDERVALSVVDEEVSIGDYVISGGELAAMVLIEAMSRQVPGVVGLADSVENDSFRRELLDHPHYTRPRLVEGLGVPEVLLSGNHARIAAWRRRQSLKATLLKRPDLLARAELDEEQRRTVAELAEETGAALPPASASPSPRRACNARSTS